QFQNGLQISGELHVLSRNGGLLLLPELVHHGSVANLMFQTHRGRVRSAVELLKPVTSTQQPFRFVSLPEGDQRILQTAFQSGLYRNMEKEERMEERRAAGGGWDPPPPRRYFAKLGLVALVGCFVCALFIHVLQR